MTKTPIGRRSVLGAAGLPATPELALPELALPELALPELARAEGTKPREKITTHHGTITVGLEAVIGVPLGGN